MTRLNEEKELIFNNNKIGIDYLENELKLAEEKYQNLYYENN